MGWNRSPNRARIGRFSALPCWRFPRVVHAPDTDRRVARGSLEPSNDVELFAVFAHAERLRKFFRVGQLGLSDEGSAFPRSLGRDLIAVRIFILMLFSVRVKGLGVVGVVDDHNLVGALIEPQELRILSEAIP